MLFLTPKSWFDPLGAFNPQMLRNPLTLLIRGGQNVPPYFLILNNSKTVIANPMKLWHLSYLMVLISFLMLF